MIGLVSDISVAKTPLERALKIFAALRWAAGKTETVLDDELVEVLEAVLQTTEGTALFSYFEKLGHSLSKMEA